jgi:DUF4097 and DUF4098 domain-containing protein YvlB
MLMFAASAVSAAEHASRRVSVEHAIRHGGSLAVENLLGSITIRGGEEHREATIEARIVAEGKTVEQAQALADSVELRESKSANGYIVHVAFPVERHTAFRAPSEEQDSRFKRWVTAALDRDNVGVEYDSRVVQVGRQKGAAALAVHLTIQVPMDVRSSFRQVVGTIEGETSRGDMRLEVVDGRIKADHLYGTLHARSGGGFVEVTSFIGDELAVQTATGDLELAEVRTRSARVTTGSGTIQIDGIEADDLDVASGSGDVAIARAEPRRLAIEAGAGDVDLAPLFSKTKEATVHAGTGDVVLRVSEIASFSVAAETRSGEVRANGLELSEEAAGGVRRWRRGVGGPEVRIRAEQGEVTVRTR